MGGPFYFFFFFVLLCKYRKVAHLEQQCFYERGFPDFNFPPPGRVTVRPLVLHMCVMALDVTS